MKECTKRKLKKTIYAALVLSYILIITTVTTQAVSGTVYDYIQIGYPEFHYDNSDGETTSYTDSLEMWVGVEKINNSSIHTTILLTIDENIDINPIFIDLIQTNYRLTNWQTRTKIGQYAKSIINTAEQIITTTIKVTKQLNGNQIQMDYYITSSSSTLWNAIYYLDNDYNSGENGGNGIFAITHKAIRGIAITENNTKVYATEMSTNAIIEEMMQINNQTSQDIYDELVGGGETFEGGTINPMPDLSDAEDEAIGVYDDLFNRYEQEIEDYITNGNGVIPDEVEGIFQSNVIVSRILGMPYIILVVPIATFMIILKNLLV